jgi:hypothetical protein
MTSSPATNVDSYLQQSSMIRLAKQFEQLATGAAQVPRQQVRTRIRDRIADADVLEYHDRLVPNAGPLFSHFLASIPGILEEMSRVGVALSRLSRKRAERDDRPHLFYEIDAFDGSNGRTLAAFSDGNIKTLTCSPNKANEEHFHRFADPARSRFIPTSFLKLDDDVLRTLVDDRDFHDGFDYIYETAAFQFYGKDRDFQIEQGCRMLREDGLVFFLEKLDHADRQEYERRERVKDEQHKTHYFTPEEIEWKRQQMLLRMHEGEVLLDDLVSAIGRHFSHCYLLWNSTNFYEFVASNDGQRIDEFVRLLGPPLIEEPFVFERPMMRKVLERARG